MEKENEARRWQPTNPDLTGKFIDIITVRLHVSIGLYVRRRTERAGVDNISGRRKTKGRGGRRPGRREVVGCDLAECPSSLLVTVTIRLRFDCNSITVRLPFDCLSTDYSTTYVTTV